MESRMAKCEKCGCRLFETVKFSNIDNSIRVSDGTPPLTINSILLLRCGKCNAISIPEIAGFHRMELREKYLNALKELGVEV